MSESKKVVIIAGHIGYSKSLELAKHLAEQQKPIVLAQDNYSSDEKIISQYEKGISNLPSPLPVIQSIQTFGKSHTLEHLEQNIKEIVEDYNNKQYKSTSTPKSGRDERRERRKLQRRNKKK